MDDATSSAATVPVGAPSDAAIDSTEADDDSRAPPAAANDGSSSSDSDSDSSSVGLAMSNGILGQ